MTDSMHTPHKTADGWVVTISAELLSLLGVEAGTQAVLFVREHRLEVDIVPPPSPELLADMHAIYDALPRLRLPHPDIAGKMRILGDVLESIPEADWDLPS